MTDQDRGWQGATDPNGVLAGGAIEGGGGRGLCQGRCGGGGVGLHSGQLDNAVLLDTCAIQMHTQVYERKYTNYQLQAVFV